MPPPLNAIRAFTLAARHRSFTLAASELSVTQGAVSQQIARFEDYLGVRLFERRGGGLALTGAGQRLYQAVAEPLDQIERATLRARSDSRETPLSITTLPSFASQWLMPRLSTFQRRYPNVRLRLETTLVVMDLVAGEFDGAVRHGPGEWPGVTAEPLMEMQLFPVATPRYAATLDLDRGPGILRSVPLYYDTDGEHEWLEWLTAAGAEGEGLHLTHGFTDSVVMLRALMSGGDGVALMRSGLADSELADGSVVRLFDTSIKLSWRYYLVYPSGRPFSESFAAFRAWLFEEVAAYQVSTS